MANEISKIKLPNNTIYDIKDVSARSAAATAQSTADGKISSSLKGVANGVAELDANGLVPTSQLPSYVDDVLEYATKSVFPITGESGKIYVDISTNLTYRWSGTAYVEISPSLALGETSSTAYRGDRGKTAYAHATDSNRLTTATAVGLYKVGVTTQGHVSGLTAVAKADITALGIPAQDTTYSSGTGITISGTTINHSNSVTAGTAKGDNTKTLSFGGTFTIPTVTYDAQGHITAKGTTTMTMPSNPNTDTKVTAVGNHYAPAEDSTAQLDADASSTTAATWNSTSLVTGITVKRDAKGHVTGIAVDSIKMPANPNTNTTYTIGTSGNNITLTPSRGSAQSITAPYATSAGSATNASQLTKASTLDTADKVNAFIGTALRYASVSSGIVTSTDGLVLTIPWNEKYGQQIFFNDDSYVMKHRYCNNETWSDWKGLIDESNINDYAPTKSGTGASGTWGISISGNAATASDSSKLNGYTSDTAATNNTIVRRTNHGFIFATYLNQSSGAETPTTDSYWMFCNSDGFLRKSTLANLASTVSSSITPYETKLQWGNTNNVGSVSPIGCALSSEHSANRLAFINGAALAMEYSSNGGSTYTDYGYSAAQKSQFCTTSFDVPIGRKSGNYTTSSRTRITLTATTTSTQYVYTSPKKMLINVSTSGGMQVLVEYRTGDNYKSSGAWSTFGTYNLSGWSGWNEIPLVLARLGGSTSQTNQIWQLRLTFIMTSVHSSYPSTASVLGIRIFGDTCWYITSNMGYTGHLYSYDASQNATFPAQVTATQFNGALSGNATSATSATTSQYLTVSRVAKDSQSLPGANKCIVEEYSSGTNYNLPSNAYYHIYSSQGDDTRYGCQLALGMNTEAAYYRVYNNQSWGNWKSIINTNTDVNVKVNNTNPASGTWYYPTWYTATSGTGNVNANDGFRYYSLQGTASAAGRSIMQVGNATQTGTAGNKYGEFRIYSQKQGYSTLTMASGATAERKHTLPDIAGTIGVFTATPTSGQVVVSDGTAGGFKTTGYTIAKSVPSNAVFTDSSGNNRVLRAGDNMTGSLTTTGSFIADTQVGAPTIAASSNLYAGDFCKITSSGTTGTNGSAYIRAINDESGTTHTLIKIGNGSVSCENNAGTPVSLTASSLELSHATPLIDFHHNSSTQDFTSRIITTNLAELTFYGKNSSGTTVYGTCRGAAFTVVSSKYMKENIKDIEDDEAKKLLQLRPVSFDYKYTGETNKRGLIAEEVLDIMPEMVYVPEDYSEPMDDTIPDNVPSIDYSKFVPYLIKMVQIQQQEIDQLKEQIK